MKLKSKFLCEYKNFDFRKINDLVYTQSNRFIRDHDRDRGAECDRGAENDHDHDHDAEF